MSEGYLNVEGPTFIGFCFNLLLMGILFVQVYIYHVAFPKDHWSLKLIVYAVFAIELAQTAIMMFDRVEVYVIQFANVAALDLHLHMWFSLPILTAVTSTIIQGFFGYRIRVLSGSWIGVAIVWTGTVAQLGSGIAQGILSKPIPMHEMYKTKPTLIAWCVSTTVTDAIIAILLTYYLLKLKTGIEETDRLLTRIIRLTVETGTLTAITALLILILFFSVKAPWFLVFTDCIGKIYANNLLVMFNRRVDFTVNGTRSTQFASRAKVSGTLDNSTFKVASIPRSTQESAWELSHRGGKEYLAGRESAY